jgi:hypothetical protein
MSSHIIGKGAFGQIFKIDENIFCKKMEISYNNTKEVEFLSSLFIKSKRRLEPNKEWFLSEEDAEDFIKIIEECKTNNL